MKSKRVEDWTASDWLVALADEPRDAETLERFADWLEAHPDNLRAWKASAAAYRGLDSAVPTGAPHRRGRRRWLSIGMPAALAGAAIAACLLVLALPMLLRDLGADHATGTGEIRSVTLADGTVVRLAPQSAIEVEYGAAGRRVRLLEGIALFEVSLDPVRPFTVQAASTLTTAVGTAFEVRSGTGADGVAVRDGIVEVEAVATDEAFRLGAGESLRVGPEGGLQRSESPAVQVGLWVDGLVVARDRPVADLVDELRRYHRGVILLDGTSLGAQPATGVFDAADPAAALELLASSQAAKLYEITPWLLILRGP